MSSKKVFGWSVLLLVSLFTVSVLFHPYCSPLSPMASSDTKNNTNVTPASPSLSSPSDNDPQQAAPRKQQTPTLRQQNHASLTKVSPCATSTTLNDTKQIDGHPTTLPDIDQLAIRGDRDGDPLDDLYTANYSHEANNSTITSYSLSESGLQRENRSFFQAKVTNVKAGDWYWNDNIVEGLGAVYVWTETGLWIGNGSLKQLKHVAGSYANHTAHHYESDFSIFDFLFNRSTGLPVMFENGETPTSPVKTLQSQLVGLDIGRYIDSSQKRFFAAANRSHILFQKWDGEGWYDSVWGYYTPRETVYALSIYDWDDDGAYETFWLGEDNIHVIKKPYLAGNTTQSLDEEFILPFQGDSTSHLCIEREPSLESSSYDCDADTSPELFVSNASHIGIFNLDDANQDPFYHEFKSSNEQVEEISIGNTDNDAYTELTVATNKQLWMVEYFAQNDSTVVYPIATISLDMSPDLAVGSVSSSFHEIAVITDAGVELFREYHTLQMELITPEKPYESGASVEVTVCLNISDEVTVSLYRNKTAFTNCSGMKEGVYNISTTMSFPENGTYNLTVNTSTGFYLQFSFMHTAEDTFDPTPRITFPGNHSYWHNTSISIEWSASDNYKVDNCTLRYNTTEGTAKETFDYSSTTSYSFNVSNNSAIYYVSLTATDVNGRSNTTSIYLYNDFEDPNITITTTNEKNVSHPWINVSWHAEDNFAINKATLIVNGTPLQNETSQNWANITIQEEGTVNLTIHLYDMVYLHTQDGIHITVDLTDPTVRITKPSLTSFTTSKVATAWIGRDEGTGIHKYQYTIGPWTWRETTKTNLTLYIPNGNHTLQVIAIDWVGRTATQSISIQVSAPLPHIALLSNETYTNSSRYVVRWHGNETDTWIAHYQLQIDHQETISLANETTSYVCTLAEGNHTVSITIFDCAGNTATTAQTIVVDKTTPILTLQQPTQQAVDNTFTIVWQGNDTGSGIDHFAIRIDTETWHTLGRQTSYHVHDLSEGTHRITIRAVDHASNIASLTHIVSVETSHTLLQGYRLFFMYLGLFAAVIGSLFVAVYAKLKKEGVL